MPEQPSTNETWEPVDTYPSSHAPGEQLCTALHTVPLSIPGGVELQISRTVSHPTLHPVWAAFPSLCHSSLAPLPHPCFLGSPPQINCLDSGSACGGTQTKTPISILLSQMRKRMQREKRTFLCAHSRLLPEPDIAERALDQESGDADLGLGCVAQDKFLPLSEPESSNCQPRPVTSLARALSSRQADPLPTRSYVQMLKAS